MVPLVKCDHHRAEIADERSKLFERCDKRLSKDGYTVFGGITSKQK